jgi:macrophage erythroblast attacher
LDNQLEEGSKTEHLQAQRCRARLDHLESADAENMSEWSSTRLKRILVDYMLRMSYYDTAIKLAQDSNIQVIFWSFCEANCASCDCLP